MYMQRRYTQEHVGHDGPGFGSGDLATESEDLTGEHPPDETDGVLRLVVGGDGNVDEFEAGVCVSEGDDGNVHIGSLADGLGVDAGVGDNDETGLLEGLGDVVSEVAGSEATSNGHSTSVGGKLKHGTVAVWTG